MRNMQNSEVWGVLTQTNEWIRFADAKATALLAAGGVLGGLLVISVPAPDSWGECLPQLVFFTGAILAVVLSTIMSLFALLPRLGRHAPPSSLIYFNDVARRFANDREGFALALTTAVDDPAVMRADVVTQIWANSKVAHRKYRGLTYGTWLIGAAMFLAGISALLPHK